ncbi:MAG: hypothetical protein KJT03_08400, partial [Verrucomicrobiae bacterium]|nr:hypothetical protein [Verrucomicrobiae bacterium]
VWKAGARSAFHEPSGTEIPLIWDPVYQRHAFNFLRHVQEKYGDNPHILFLDVTPGAETNPYRFGTIDRRNPEFRETFLQVVASDGKPYSDKLWINTLQDWITEMPKVVTSIPLLVTLNVAGLGTNASDRLTEVGAFCVEHGYLVGQNGLGKHSYLTESKRKQAFLSWSEKTPLFFEMVARSGRRTGTLMEVMQAAERIHCSLLNVYPEDVLKGTPGNKDYDPAFEAALRYGANALSR